MSPTLQKIRDLLPNCLQQDRERIEAKLGHVDEHQLLRLLKAAENSSLRRQLRFQNFPQVNYPPTLPIVLRKEEIVQTMRKHQVVIIVGETGSGKTTQIPKMCLEAGFGGDGKIGCTQPRRVAALSISRRVAQELKLEWGRGVGCKIRFNDQSSPETYIKFMTDGILLAELQNDPELKDYEVLVIDEAHERSLNIDFILGHLKSVITRRPDLKLVITSATIDAEGFSRAFDNAPIIEVSGRLFPVTVDYRPLKEADEETREQSYVDAACEIVEEIVLTTGSGDVLVFMPGERDIRETQDLLEGRLRKAVEVIPLFGRLTAGEQERAFASGPVRKIIIATNIAETSLTIPGIRYVVDTGMARVSRYSPRTRTRRLPIEPIAQSNANQRAGRAGRVEDGFCIRLYSQEDYEARPKFAQPEIQRANLAEVILRMKASRLGEVETFPFINPPQPQAISAGYDLLYELGALDENRLLTPLGRSLARLPVDPTIGRMLLQSVKEGAVDETLVIAAGLSIQDPRERPMDNQNAADEAHRQFRDPDSDFIGLLNVWKTYHQQREALKTRSQLRRFCRTNFLSYIRMIEWVDVHDQLSDSIDEHIRVAKQRDEVKKSVTKSEKDGVNYIGIHRSILTGLLANIGQREERNLYKFRGNKEVAIFPASNVCFRPVPTRRVPGKATGAEPVVEKSGQPDWIVAGELMETSKLYARTVGGINPKWVVELGEHLCKKTHGPGIWNRKAGRVLTREKVALHGFLLQEESVDFGNINPEAATDIFIRSALVEQDVDMTWPFVEANTKLAAKLQVARTRMRNNQLPDPDETLFNFYRERLDKVSSVHELNRYLREHDQSRLLASENDLTKGTSVEWDAKAFPSETVMHGARMEMDYAYAPGEKEDGVTIRVPFPIALQLKAGQLDWVVPGIREEQIEFLLRALPKASRVALMPLPPKVKELATVLNETNSLEDLRLLVQKKYGVPIPPGSWVAETLPDHLRPRISVVGGDKKEIVQGRDLKLIHSALAAHETPGEKKAWDLLAERIERYDVKEWSFDDLPLSYEVSAINGIQLLAFPGLQLEEGRINLTLFKREVEAQDATRGGMFELAKRVLQRELAWLQKDLRSLEKFGPDFVTLGSREDLLSTAFTGLLREILVLPEPPLPLVKATFEKVVGDARLRINVMLSQYVEMVGQILQARQQLLAAKTSYTGMKEDLGALITKDFLATTPFEKLKHLPRFLKSRVIRAQRAALAPGKDLEKQKLVNVYRDKLSLLKKNKLGRAALKEVDELRWMIEEYGVSLFAQELGTSQPVSPKRLEAQIEKIKGLI